MKRSAIGLDIGVEHVCAAQLAWTPAGEAELVAAACFERAGRGGPVTAREVRRCVEALRRQGFVGDQIALALPLSQQLAAVCDLPPRASGAPVEVLAREELARAHRCEASRLQSSVWELSAGSVRGRVGGSGEHVACLVAGCTVDDVEGWIGRMTEAEAEVVTLDLRSLALMRGTHVRNRGDALVIDLQNEHAHLVAIVAGRVVYERILPEHGLELLRTRLAGLMRWTPAHSERWLCTHGLRALARHDRAPGALAMMTMVMEWGDQLATEASASMVYAAQRVMMGPEVASGAPRLLSGPGARWAGLVEHVANRGACESRVCSPSGVVSITPACSEWGDEPVLITAIGLALHRDARVRGRRASSEEAHA